MRQAPQGRPGGAASADIDSGCLSKCVRQGKNKPSPSLFGGGTILELDLLISSLGDFMSSATPRAPTRSSASSAVVASTEPAFPYPRSYEEKEPFSAPHTIFVLFCAMGLVVYAVFGIQAGAGADSTSNNLKCVRSAAGRTRGKGAANRLGTTTEEYDRPVSRPPPSLTRDRCSLSSASLMSWLPQPRLLGGGSLPARLPPES